MDLPDNFKKTIEKIGLSFVYERKGSGPKQVFSALFLVSSFTFLLLWIYLCLETQVKLISCSN